MARMIPFLNISVRDFLTILQTLFPVLLVVAVGGTFHEFIWHAMSGHLLLNVGIFTVALGGSALMVYRLLEFQRERRVLWRYSREVTAGNSMVELLDQPWLKNRVMHRYLDHIAQTGGKLSSQLDQDAIENELHAIQSEFDSKLELPNFLVGFMVAMGLLGTFIGLLETLTGISSMLDGMSGGGGGNIEDEFIKLVAELRKPLAGMGIAFAASMFGLVGSLMLGVMLLFVRRYMKRLMSDARQVLHSLTERIRGPVSAMGGAAIRQGGVSQEFLADFMGELIENINALQDLFHRSQDASLALSNRVDGLANRLEQMSGAIENNVTAVKKTNDLLGFGPRMKETNEEMLAEIKALGSNAADQQKVLTRLVDVLNSMDLKLGVGNDSQRLYQDAHANIGRDTLTKLDEAVGLLHSVNDRGADAENRLERRMQALTTSTTAMVSNLQQLTAKMGEVATIGQNQLGNAGAVQQMMRDASTEMMGSLKELHDRMKRVEEVNVGGARHLWEIKEGISGMGSSLEGLDQIAQGIGRQTTVLEATLEELRTSQRNLSRDLQKELREFAREQTRETRRTTAMAEG